MLRLKIDLEKKHQNGMYNKNIATERLIFNNVYNEKTDEIMQILLCLESYKDSIITKEHIIKDNIMKVITELTK